MSAQSPSRRPTAFSLNGETLVPSVAGGLYWPREETLIVSDLHFEKGSAFARRGVLLPPYDTRATLQRLRALIAQFDPRRIVSLGDAFHDVDAEQRMDEEDAALLSVLMKGREWVWVLGNHDPMPPKRFTGEVAAAKRIGRLVFRHEPSPGAAPGELAGHLHPCAKVLSEGRTLRARCFAVGGQRAILPAFGAFTGGLNVLDEAYQGMFPSLTAWVIGRRAVYPVGEKRLARDNVVPFRLRAAG